MTERRTEFQEQISHDLSQRSSYEEGEQNLLDDEICPHCVRNKHTPRSIEFQADLQRRLNRAIGQLNGIKSMIDENRYCGDVLVQLSATRSAIQSIERLVLHNHLETCVVEEIRAGNDEIVEEAMELIKRVSK